MKKFGLIGHPLGHTLSPFIHKKLFKLSGINATYEVFDIPPNDLPDKIEFLKTLDGFNVTIPHKVSVMEWCDEVGSSVGWCGAINTVKTENGISTGSNTDWIGFQKALNNHFKKLYGISDRAARCLLVGAGGAARAAAFWLRCRGYAITIAAREEDVNAAKQIKLGVIENCPIRSGGLIVSMELDNSRIDEKIRQEQDENTRVVKISEISGEYDLLVNATPVGMYPNVKACPVPESVIKNCKNVFDMVYNPAETELVKIAKSLGKNAATGMAMLVWQAAAAHEIWYGAKFNHEDISKLIEETSAQL